MSWYNQEGASYNYGGGTFLIFMKSIFTIVEEISHQLNSPLAGIKSYAYLSKRFLEKNDKKKTTEYLDLLDKKIDLVAHRIDLVLTALRLETTAVPVTYHLFDVAEITGTAYHAEILADKTALNTVLMYAKQLAGSSHMSVSGDKKEVQIRINYTARPQSADKDINTEYIEKTIIMYRLVKLHGGTIKDSRKDLKITLPLKPPTKKK